MVSGGGGCSISHRTKLVTREKTMTDTLTANCRYVLRYLQELAKKGDSTVNICAPRSPSSTTICNLSLSPLHWNTHLHLDLHHSFSNIVLAITLRWSLLLLQLHLFPPTFSKYFTVQYVVMMEISRGICTIFSSSGVNKNRVSILKY